MEKVSYINCFNGDCCLVFYVCFSFNNSDCTVLSCLWFLQCYDYADHHFVGGEDCAVEIEGNCVQFAVYSYDCYRDSVAGDVVCVNRFVCDLDNFPNSNSSLYYCSHHHSNSENVIDGDTLTPVYNKDITIFKKVNNIGLCVKVRVLYLT